MSTAYGLLNTFKEYKLRLKFIQKANQELILGFDSLGLVRVLMQHQP